MVSQPPSISAVVLKGLRGRILNDLKMHQPLAANELAARYGVSANAVRRHLKELGFMAEWTPSADGGLRIAEHNCAMQAVAERYPEICDAEADFLREILQADVRRDAHIPHGCNACEYAVSVAGHKPAQPATKESA